ncbi:AzlD family protein [Natrialba taiwanensis]|uniref:Branched-chain amino acid transport n=1 Tax=Natrialba taiwanensis DSM 12281 TaxID=1230458 RepID=M0ACA3_9EURY|nr:AzlD domain-containing protein [Natrialba taiwanensis]ELY95996.1 branched-chain amino acid transport [Natrialba taiwanensis DSM 12281]
MLPELHLTPSVVAVILGMSAVTYITKAGGLWLLSRIEVPEYAEAGLAVLPGAIIVSIVGPELARAGPPEWGAGAVALLVAWRTENVLLALVSGVAAVLLFRGV